MGVLLTSIGRCKCLFKTKRLTTAGDRVADSIKVITLLLLLLRVSLVWGVLETYDIQQTARGNGSGGENSSEGFKTARREEQISAIEFFFLEKEIIKVGE